MTKKEIDFSHIKTGIELQNFLREQLNPLFSNLYFHIDYDNDKYKRLRIVLYNADNRTTQYEISLSGNITLLLRGFDNNDRITNSMSLECIKSREIEILMHFSTQNGNINKIGNYIIKKFKMLNLEKVTCSTKHMKFDEVEIPVVEEVIKPIVVIDEKPEVWVKEKQEKVVEVIKENEPKEIINSDISKIISKEKKNVRIATIF